MPTLKHAPSQRELQKLEKIFLEAEQAIIDEIGRLRSLGLADYHVNAALDRVQEILRKLRGDSREYAPRMIEGYFYARHPEKRRVKETVAKHVRAYENAEALAIGQTAIVERLVENLMGAITEATLHVEGSLSRILREMVIGRLEPDVFRAAGLETAARMQAAGRGVFRTIPDFVNRLRREGVTAFVDKAGRHWSLHTYGSMALRTTSRQAEVLSVLTADEEQDLYKVTSHKTSCPVCAPYEGRVYSKSGTDPDFPPLADAFGKIDPKGPNDLTNTYLNIHPNCLHALAPWSPAGMSQDEIDRIKRFSSPKENPYSVDPRSKKQIEAYRKKELARRHFLQTYDQWERYRLALGDQVPKTYQTFEKHKRAKDEKYKRWQKLYRAENARIKEEQDGIY